MMQDQVVARAVLMAGELDGQKMELLRVLCAAAISGLTMRLKDGLTAEDCREEFITAASLHAMAAMSSFEETVQEFKAGDLTVKQNRDGYSTGLEQQAEKLMKPYLRDCFVFSGV